jgi:hypothetical protein
MLRQFHVMMRGINQQNVFEAKKQRDGFMSHITSHSKDSKDYYGVTQIALISQIMMSEGRGKMLAHGSHGSHRFILH